MKVVFTAHSWTDCTSWVGDRKTLTRINRLIAEAARDPGAGPANPNGSPATSPGSGPAASIRSTGSSAPSTATNSSSSRPVTAADVQSRRPEGNGRDHPDGAAKAVPIYGPVWSSTSCPSIDGSKTGNGTADHCHHSARRHPRRGPHRNTWYARRSAELSAPTPTAVLVQQNADSPRRGRVVHPAHIVASAIIVARSIRASEKSPVPIGCRPNAFHAGLGLGGSRAQDFGTATAG